MGVLKANRKLTKRGPSTFALLVDDINKMSEPQQKLLWLQINKEKVSALAKELDNSVTPHNLAPETIDLLIKEARKHGRSKKKKRTFMVNKSDA
jgi:hypothetical protein